MSELKGNEKFTDEQLKQALIDCGGQPTKAAEMLGVEYVTVYYRVRKNPELLEIQKASRAKTFNDLANISLRMAIAGTIKQPISDENGKIISDDYEDVLVDYKTRTGVIQSLMGLYKGDEGIKDELDITHNGGSVPIELWLERNTVNDSDTESLRTDISE